MSVRYAVIFEQATNNSAAYVPDLPGCITTGRPSGSCVSVRLTLTGRLRPLALHSSRWLRRAHSARCVGNSFWMDDCHLAMTDAAVKSVLWNTKIRHRPSSITQTQSSNPLREGRGEPSADLAPVIFQSTSTMATSF